MKPMVDLLHLGKPDGCFYVPACGAPMDSAVTLIRGGVTCQACREKLPEAPATVVHKRIPSGRPACGAVVYAPLPLPRTAYRWDRVTCGDCQALRHRKVIMTG